MFGASRRDPRQVAPIGSYLTDETVLLEVLESDWSGVLGEDLASGNLLEIEPHDLQQHWRRVRPHPAAA